MARSPFQFDIGATVYAVAPVIPVRSAASDASEQVTQLLIGERCEVLALGERDWVEVRGVHDGYAGWCDAKMLTDRQFEPNHLLRPVFSLWRWPDGSVRSLPAGAWLEETEEGWKAPDGARVKPVEVPMGSDWRAWLGAPYLWGGRTAAGVDCSGFMQVMARLERPEAFVDRDAADQMALGTAVPFAEHRAGDWAFFANSAGRIVHVGLITARNEIVHAAGQVRRDRLTEDGIERELSDGTWRLTHVLAGIRRHAS